MNQFEEVEFKNRVWHELSMQLLAEMNGTVYVTLSHTRLGKLSDDQFGPVALAINSVSPKAIE